MSITSVLNSAVSSPASSGTSAASTAFSTASGTTGTSASGQMLTEQDFLTLLITQLQNQDPTSPASDTQLAEEMASFTTANGMSSADTLLQQISTEASSLNTALGIGTAGAGSSTSASGTSTSGTAA